MRKKPIAVVLAGTVPHIRLIERLKHRGYHTILIDYYEQPPAKQAADEHLQESTLDQETVLQVAKDVNADVVITTCMDHANVTACYVAEQLGLPAPYSHQTALNVTNKQLMKETMLRNGIPTSKYACVSDVSACASLGLRFPVVVKPADSNGSKGVRKACDRGELAQFFGSAQEASRTAQVIVEEYKEGREIGVDAVIKNDKASIIMTRERRKVVTRGDPTQQIQGSYWPADISERNMSDLKRIANDIGRAFGLSNTPLIIQTIVDGDKISVIEFGARIGGGENYKIIELHTGLDIIDAAIDSCLGRPMTLEYRSPVQYYADIYLYSKPGPFGEIAGYQRLLAEGVLEYLNVYKARGMTIGPDLSGNNRVGAFLVGARDKAGLLRKIRTAINCIEVYDTAGRPVMRRDIYSTDS